MAIEAHEFIRRFLLHGLPDGFHRIRHYGYLANGHRVAKLALIRKLLKQQPPEAIQRTGDYRTRLLNLMGIDIDKCPCCGGDMRIIATLARARAPPREHPQAPSG